MSRSITVFLSNPKKPELGVYKSVTFFEGRSGSLYTQLQNLTDALDEGFVIDKIERKERKIKND